MRENTMTKGLLVAAKLSSYSLRDRLAMERL